MMNEPFGQFIQPHTLVYVVFYYFSFWLINVSAYSGVGIGILRWRRFIEGTGADVLARNTAVIALSFASVRFVSGAFGLIVLELGLITWLETIIFLGVISLLLNTSFIMLEAYFINREAKRILGLDGTQRNLMKQMIRQMNSLRNTLDNK